MRKALRFLEYIMNLHLCMTLSTCRWLFRKGTSRFSHPRMQKLAKSVYFCTRLYNYRKNITYLLHAAVADDTMLLKQEINVYIKMCKKIIMNKQIMCQ